MTDSNFTEFDAQLMMGSFFGLIVIFGVLSGFGILQDEVGEPPQLVDEDEEFLDISVGDFPQSPGQGNLAEFVEDDESFGDTVWDGNIEITDGLYMDVIQVHSYDSETEQREYIIYFVDSNGDAVDDVRVGGSHGYKSTFTWDSGEVTVEMAYQELVDPDEDPSSGSDRQVGISATYEESSYWDYVPLIGGVADEVAQGVFWVGQIIYWMVGTAISLVVSVILAVVKMLSFVTALIWYIISAWLALGSMDVWNTYTWLEWLGYAVQGITFAMFIGLFNGVAKIIKMIPTT